MWAVGSAACAIVMAEYPMNVPTYFQSSIITNFLSISNDRNIFVKLIAHIRHIVVISAGLKVSETGCQINKSSSLVLQLLLTKLKLLSSNKLHPRFRKENSVSTWISWAYIYIYRSLYNNKKGQQEGVTSTISLGECSLISPCINAPFCKMTHIKNTHHLCLPSSDQLLTVKIGGLNFQTLSFEFWHLEVEIVLLSWSLMC
jgi:hypothetical protein